MAFLSNISQHDLCFLAPAGKTLVRVHIVHAARRIIDVPAPLPQACTLSYPRYWPNLKLSRIALAFFYDPCQYAVLLWRCRPVANTWYFTAHLRTLLSRLMSTYMVMRFLSYFAKALYLAYTCIGWLLKWLHRMFMIYIYISIDTGYLWYITGFI